MSHFTTIKTEIYDLKVLKETLKELNYNLSYNVTLLGYGNQKYIVNFQGELNTYNLGFKKNLKNGYDIVGDLYLIPNSRNMINKIKQTYAKKIVIRNLKRSGYKITSVDQNDNQIIKIVMIKR